MSFPLHIAQRAASSPRGVMWKISHMVFVNEGICELRIALPTGNKLDLTSSRQVSRERAEEFANVHNLCYVETSAKEADNVEQLFLELASELTRNARHPALAAGPPPPRLSGQARPVGYFSCCGS